MEVHAPVSQPEETPVPVDIDEFTMSMEEAVKVVEVEAKKQGTRCSIKRVLAVSTTVIVLAVLVVGAIDIIGKIQSGESDEKPPANAPALERHVSIANDIHIVDDLDAKNSGQRAMIQATAGDAPFLHQWFGNPDTKAVHHDGGALNATRALVAGKYETKLVSDGCYEVHEWHPSGPRSQMSLSVSIDVMHANGVASRVVDQSSRGGQWNVVGAFDFKKGAAEVTLSNRASRCIEASPCYTTFDAVRFVYVSPQCDSHQKPGSSSMDNMFVSGYIVLAVSDVSSFISEQKIVPAVKEALAALAGVSSQSVAVSLMTGDVRLSSALQPTPSVVVSYRISTPSEEQPSALADALNAKTTAEVTHAISEVLVAAGVDHEVSVLDMKSTLTDLDMKSPTPETTTAAAKSVQTTAKPGDKLKSGMEASRTVAKEVVTATTVTSEAVLAGATTVKLRDVSGFSVGDVLTISDNTNTEIKTIVSITYARRRLGKDGRRLAAGSVTVDSPLKVSFAAGATTAKATPTTTSEIASGAMPGTSSCMPATIINDFDSNLVKAIVSPEAQDSPGMEAFRPGRVGEKPYFKDWFGDILHKDFHHDAHINKGLLMVNYTTPLKEAGCYLLQEWHLGGSKHCMNYMPRSVPFHVQGADGEQIAYADQSINGGQWNSLGLFSFSTSATIMVSNKDTDNCLYHGTCYTVFDSLRLVRVGDKCSDADSSADSLNRMSDLACDVPGSLAQLRYATGPSQNSVDASTADASPVKLLEIMSPKEKTIAQPGEHLKVSFRTEGIANNTKVRISLMYDDENLGSLVYTMTSASGELHLPMPSAQYIETYTSVKEGGSKKFRMRLDVQHVFVELSSGWSNQLYAYSPYFTIDEE